MLMQINTNMVWGRTLLPPPLSQEEEKNLLAKGANSSN